MHQKREFHPTLITEASHLLPEEYEAEGILQGQDTLTHPEMSLP